MKRKLRFLNMDKAQIARREARQKKQDQRKQAKAKTKRSATEKSKTKAKAKAKTKAKHLKSSRSATEHPKSRSAAEHPAWSRRARPCCGLRCDKCKCKPPPGLHRRPLNALAARYLTTPLNTVGDTTDVSKFQHLMKEHCESLPIWVVLMYSFVHVMFNQEELLKEMLDKKAFLCKPPWVDWTVLKAIIRMLRPPKAWFIGKKPPKVTQKCFCAPPGPLPGPLNSLFLSRCFAERPGDRGGQVPPKGAPVPRRPLFLG